MQEQDKARSVNRRGLLRRAGTVAAGAAGVTVAGAMVSAPAAQAAPGDAVLAGQPNTSGAETTTLTGGDVAKPTLHLRNVDGDGMGQGPALQVATSWPTGAAPGGSVFIDDYGDFNAITEDAGVKYLTTAYSPTWAAMPVPLPPFRWVDTRTTGGRQYVSGASYDSTGRIVPKDSNTADAVIDLSAVFTGGYGAVQANLAIVNPTGQGYAALWDEGEWPGTSSINFGLVTGMPAIANFTQTLIGEDRKIRLKLNRPAVVLFDIVGFVLADPYSQLAGVMTGSSAGAKTAAKGSERRRPRKIS